MKKLSGELAKRPSITSRKSELLTAAADLFAVAPLDEIIK